MSSFAIFFAEGFSTFSFYGGHLVVYPSLRLRHTRTQLRPFKEAHFLPLHLICQFCGPTLPCTEAHLRFVWNIYIVTEFVGARPFWAEDRQLWWAGGPNFPCQPRRCSCIYMSTHRPVHTGTAAEHSVAEEAVHRRSSCGVIWAHMELSHQALQAPGRMAPRLHNHRRGR